MKALSVQGGGAALDRISCRVGALEHTRIGIGRLIGLELDILAVVLVSSTSEDGFGEISLGLGDGLR